MDRVGLHYAFLIHRLRVLQLLVTQILTAGGGNFYIGRLNCGDD